MEKRFKNLNINSNLLNYIAFTHNLSNVSIVYDEKYDIGSFTTSIPINYAKNSKLIAGYPHFNIPVEILKEEIENFLVDKPLYSNNIILRYGDTHPNKPVPSFAQTRNLFINEILKKMLTSYSSFKNIFLIGDISIKNINYIADKLNMDGEIYFKKIINGIDIENKKFLELFRENNYLAINKIREFLNIFHLSFPEFVLESTLYKNQEIYKYMKEKVASSKDFKKNGEIKYSLQELMYAMNFINDDTTFISLIGSNQYEHIKNVYSIIANNQLPIDYNFISYGICQNAKERNYNIWSLNLQNQIENLFSNISISAESFLRLLYSGSSNSRMIDFKNLNNFKNILKKYSIINKAIQTPNQKSINHNDLLLGKMALANYYIDLSIKKGEQHFFFDYVVDVSNCYLNNNSLNDDEYELFLNFIKKSLNKLNIDKLEYEEVEKCKKRY